MSIRAFKSITVQPLKLFKRVCTPAESDWVPHWCLTLSLTNVHTIYLIKNIVRVWALLPRNRHFFNRWTRSDSFSSFFTHYFVQHIILYSLWHKRYNLLNSEVFWFVFYPTHMQKLPSWHFMSGLASLQTLFFVFEHQGLLVDLFSINIQEK